MRVRDRGNAWVVAMVGCTALIAAAVASAVTTTSLKQAGQQAPTPMATSGPSQSTYSKMPAQPPPTAPVMTPQMKNAAQAAARAFPWPAQLLTGLGPYLSLSSQLFRQAPTSPYAFAEVTQGAGGGSIAGTYLARIDLATGAIELGQRTNGIPTQVGSQIGLSVPAGTTSRGAPTGPWHLAWVQPGSPKASGDLAIPQAGKGSWLPVASTADERSSGYLWAFCSNQVFEVDPATGAPSHIITFDGSGSAHVSTKLDCASGAHTPQVQNPEIGFGAGELYVPVDYLTADPTTRVPVRIFALATGSEKIEGEAVLPNAIAGPTLAPVPGGVWASYRTGMTGNAELLSNHGLDPLGRWYPKGATPYPVWALATPRTTWIQSGVQIACVAPGAASVLAATAIPSQDPDLDVGAVWNGRLFATEGQNVILEITPPSACLA